MEAVRTGVREYQPGVWPLSAVDVTHFSLIGSRMYFFLKRSNLFVHFRTPRYGSFVLSFLYGR